MGRTSRVSAANITIEKELTPIKRMIPKWSAAAHGYSTRVRNHRGSTGEIAMVNSVAITANVIRALISGCAVNEYTSG